MELNEIQIGEVYKPKSSGRCGTFDDVAEAIFIRVTEINETGDLSYDILDKDLNLLDQCSFCFKPKHLEPLELKSSAEPIRQKSIKMKLNIMMKKVLDKDVKILIKAGYIDGDLRFTEKGKEANDALNFEKNKTELVKLAQEDLKEEKEEKGCC